MSQLSLDDRSSQILNNANDSINMSVDAEHNENSMFSFDTKEKYEKVTDLKNMEDMNEIKAPKPESTMHKVGRFLSGILGGLFLAAGLAAATAVTILKVEPGA